MEHGTKLIYIDRWPSIEARTLFYLFSVPISHDTIHKELCAIDPKVLSELPNFEAFSKSSNYFHNDKILYIDNLSYTKPYTEKDFNRIQKTIAIYRRNYNRIPSLIPNHWDFYENEIRSFKKGPASLSFTLLYYRSKNGTVHFLKYIIFPFIALPGLEFYFLYINYKNFLSFKSRISELRRDRGAARRMALYNNTTEASILTNIDEQLNTAAADLERSTNNLLSSSRAISTFLISIFTIVITFLYYEYKTISLEETIVKAESNHEMMKDTLNKERDENLKLKFEINDLRRELLTKQFRKTE